MKEKTYVTIPSYELAVLWVVFAVTGFKRGLMFTKLLVQFIKKNLAQSSYFVLNEPLHGCTK